MVQSIYSNKILTQENTFLGKPKTKSFTSFYGNKNTMCLKNFITVFKSYESYYKNLVNLIFLMIAKEQLACN